MTSHESERTTALLAAAVLLALAISAIVSMREPTLETMADKHVEDTGSAPSTIKFDLKSTDNVFVFADEYGPPLKVQHVKDPRQIPTSRRTVVRVRARTIPYDTIYVMDAALSTKDTRAVANFVSPATYDAMLDAQRLGHQSSTIVVDTVYVIEKRLEIPDDTRDKALGELFAHPVQVPGQDPGGDRDNYVPPDVMKSLGIDQAAARRGDWAAAVQPTMPKTGEDDKKP